MGKKILIRAGTTVLENPCATKTIFNNTIGGNVGNLVYANSVLRALMIDDDTQIDADHYYAEGGKYSAADVDFINTEYDAFVIPLADAFRRDFIAPMKRLTGFIKKLTIPVIVVGVGVQAGHGADIMEPMPQDEAVREFVTEVLKRSSVIGVRGGSTYRYLTDKLRFPKKVCHSHRLPINVYLRAGS